MDNQTHKVIASGEGNIEIEDIKNLGLEEHIAVEAAMFFMVDDAKATYKRIMDFFERRKMVESLVEDWDHFVRHTSPGGSRKEEDSVSICSFVKAEMFGINHRVDDLINIYRELPPKQAKKVSSEARRASMVLNNFTDSLCLGILSLEMTGEPSKDDQDEVLCEAMEDAYQGLSRLIDSISKLRVAWGKRQLRRINPKMVARLQAMSIERVNRIAKAKADFEAGKITREEAMVAQYQGVELVTAAENEAAESLN